MHDLICDVIKAAIRVKSMYMKNRVENQIKKRKKYGNQRNVYINLYLKYGLRIEFTAC